MLIATGTVDSQVKLDKQFLHEFFVGPNGRKKGERYSKTKMTGIVKRKLTVPPGWIYVCRGERDLPLSWLAQTKKDIWENLKNLPVHLPFGREASQREAARVVLLTAEKPAGRRRRIRPV